MIKKNKCLIKPGDANNNYVTIVMPLCLSKEQEKIINRQSAICNFVYNKLLEDFRNELPEYIEKIKSLKYDEIVKIQSPYNKYYIRNKIPNLKNKHPFIKQVYSDVVKNTAFALADDIASYRKFKKINPNAHLPSFSKFKESFQPLVYIHDSSKIDSSNSFYYHGKEMIIKLGWNKSDEALTLKLKINHFYLKKFKHCMKQIKIVKNDNVYKLIVVFNLPQQKHNVTPHSEFASLDLNHKNLAHVIQTSGKSFEIQPPKSLKYLKKDLLKINNKIKNYDKEKNSRKYRKLNKREKQINYKMREQMKHFIGFVSNNLISNNENIIIGDYIPSPSNISRINKSIINDSNLGQFRTKLQYKCKKYKKGFEIVDESGTTRNCSYCDKDNGKIDVKIRDYFCKHCGKYIIRDENSSFNILQKSQLYKEQSGKHMPLSSIDGLNDRFNCLIFNHHGYDEIKVMKKLINNNEAILVNKSMNS